MDALPKVVSSVNFDVSVYAYHSITKEIADLEKKRAGLKSLIVGYLGDDAKTIVGDLTVSVQIRNGPVSINWEKYVSDIVGNDEVQKLIGMKEQFKQGNIEQNEWLQIGSPSIVLTVK